MREILFRGKTENGEWVYGSLILAGKYCCILESEEDVHPMDYPYLDNDIGTIDGKATPVKPETVGQYIGWADKNDQKIFEGDIVVEEPNFFNEARELHIVRWHDPSVGFEPYSDSVENCGHCGGGMTPCLTTIIGNIHDNPEFLETGVNE